MSSPLWSGGRGRGQVGGGNSKSSPFVLSRDGRAELLARPGQISRTQARESAIPCQIFSWWARAGASSRNLKIPEPLAGVGRWVGWCNVEEKFYNSSIVLNKGIPRRDRQGGVWIVEFSAHKVDQHTQGSESFDLNVLLSWLKVLTTSLRMIFARHF